MGEGFWDERGHRSVQAKCKRAVQLQRAVRGKARAKGVHVNEQPSELVLRLASACKRRIRRAG